MNPIPANPISSIAQVDGSGTEDELPRVPVPSTVSTKSLSTVVAPGQSTLSGTSKSVFSFAGGVGVGALARAPAARGEAGSHFLVSACARDRRAMLFEVLATGRRGYATAPPPAKPRMIIAGRESAGAEVARLVQASVS